MIGSKRLAAFAVLLLSSPFAAQADTTTYAFTSVTGIQYGPGISITGVLSGTTAPTTVTIVATSSVNCTDFIMAMISTPATYSLTIVKDVEVADPMLGGTITTISSCGLSRNP
jgi:hypothetical protein